MLSPFVLLALATASVPPTGPTGAEASPGTEAFYTALHGDPERVRAALLVAAPGRFVGRAVRTTGRLRTLDPGALVFDLALGETRARLHLEPEARGYLVAHAVAWDGLTVEVDGLFYREAESAAGSVLALRAWRVHPVEARGIRRDGPKTSDARTVSLEDLVYAAGRHDSRLVRVRGIYRGRNVHRDLPETSRRGRADWVVKDGYFAAWVTGRAARGDNWDLERRSSAGAEAVIDVIGVPTTAGGVVRIDAREVHLSTEPEGAVASPALSTPRGVGGALRPAVVSFAYPVAGESLRPRGRMILQFSKPLDPRSLESRVRVRYERGGVETAAPRVSHVYRDRDRALVVIPAPAPPPRTDVVVELLDGIIDVDGRALTGTAGNQSPATGVVHRERFRRGP